MPQSETIHCQLLVIGAGMAGMAAALFAANRHISTVQVGIPGEILYASGLIDLLGVHPIEKRRLWRNPWSAIAALRKVSPHHPYARISEKVIQRAVDECLTALHAAGLPYRHYKNRNTDVVTPAGSVKRTFAVPDSMWNGVIAWRHKRPCLLVDFDGLKGFSARQIQSVLGDKWPALRTARIAFPDQHAELYPERLAQALELPGTRDRLVATVLPLLKNAKALGFPAIFGITHTTEVMADLRNKFGIPVFEIPTLPPSIAGLRLKNAFEQILPSLGVRTLYQKRLIRFKAKHNGHFSFSLVDNQNEAVIEAQAAILATGRFIGQGLTADRKRIREALFDLPVSQPEDRTHWHRESLLDPAGHNINNAGLEVDDNFQPLTTNGRPAYKNLYAAGSILAHADWIRMKCGSGIAIATAHAAVKAYLKKR